jgi:hypothetical protein
LVVAGVVVHEAVGGVHVVHVMAMAVVVVVAMGHGVVVVDLAVVARPAVQRLITVMTTGVVTAARQTLRRGMAAAGPGAITGPAAAQVCGEGPVTVDASATATTTATGPIPTRESYSGDGSRGDYGAALPGRARSGPMAHDPAALACFQMLAAEARSAERMARMRARLRAEAEERDVEDEARAIRTAIGSKYLDSVYGRHQ